jgi:hypothetical protein
MPSYFLALLRGEGASKSLPKLCLRTLSLLKEEGACDRLNNFSY